MALQIINDDGIENLTDLGEVIHDFANSEKAVSVLEENDLGCGFLDGCCWPFAKAMQMQFGGEIAIFCKIDIDGVEHPDHFVLKLDFDHEGGDVAYADGDGLATEEELIAKMRKFENVRSDVSIITLAEYEAKHGAPDQDNLMIFDYEEIALADQLHKSFQKRPLAKVI